MSAAPRPPVPAPRPLVASAWASRALVGVAVVACLHVAAGVLVPLSFAVVLTFVLAGPLRRLRRHGVSEYAGSALLVGGLVVGVVTTGLALAGPAAQWWSRAPATVDALIARVDHLRAAFPLLAPPSPGAALARGPAATAPPADPVKQSLAAAGVSLTGVVVGRALRLTLTTAATVVLLFFLLASEHWVLSRTVQALAEGRRRAVFLSVARSAQREIGRYLGVVTLINLGLGAATGLAVAAIGLSNPVLWASITAVLLFVPYLGPMAIAALLLLAGMTSFDAGLAIVAPAAAFLGLHAVESSLISPHVVGRRLRLNPIAVILSVMFWGWLWGVAGTVLAVPFLIGLRCACRRARGLQLLSVYLEQSSQRELPSLRALMQQRSGA